MTTTETRHLSMRARHLREGNTSAVLRAIADGQGGAFRAGVASALGLTRPTVSTIVDELIETGLISEGAPISSGTGRPRTPLATATGPVGLGAEISADRVRAVARSLDGHVLCDTVRVLKPSRLAPRMVARTVSDAVREVLARLPPQSDPVGLVVSVPGRLSSGKDRVVSAPNLGWSGVPLKRLLDDAPALRGLAPTLANDSYLSAQHEVAARPGESFIFLHGETGVGGAVVLDGEILGGEHGWAGEFGHVTVVRNGAPCGCGRRGCLEAYVGFHAIREALGLPSGTSIDQMADTLERPGDQETRLLELSGAYLGEVIAGTLNVLDLSTVVLSGYLGVLAPHLIPSIEVALSERSLHGGTVIARAGESGRHEADGAAAVALAPFWNDVTGWIDRTRRDRGA